jgi:thiol:disulfide interchange protein DsbD
VRATAARIEAAAGGSAEARVVLAIAPGWHINANPPSLDYMIPTTLTLAGSGGATPGAPVYPSPHRQKLSFEESELLVYDGEAVIRVPVRVGAGAAPGIQTLRGEIGYQACNDQVCLAPVSVPFTLEVNVTPASAGVTRVPPAEPPTAGSSAPPTTGFQMAPPPTGSTTASPSLLDNPIARLFEKGSFTAFLSLFLIGLALNLTPCVYPMLGVTVSVFGARRAEKPIKVFAFALLYVLGIAVMYSTLGLVAALTGGLFGGFLQSPLVLAGIGLLLIALSLSMFGLWEIQLPPALLAKLGGTGTTSAAGIFFSGLVVGVFAAPCVGPPVVALLALVGAKGDPAFGFLSFFVLAMGLGFPYLVLGTFSNLLQSLPRSGEWMVWVKKLFGLILASVGAFYVLLAVAPKQATWVMPVSLIVGGLWLGFLERGVKDKPLFRVAKRVGGALAVISGIAFIATTPSAGISFAPYAHAEVAGDLPRSRPVMLDFSADWCIPCHELERATFTDRRVIEAARDFDAYKVDLTSYNSPESEALRKQYGITGVPTIVFLDDHAREIRAARVEGFMPPEPFLRRMRLAASGTAQVSAQ